RSPTLLSSHKSATYASSSSFLTATPTSEIYTLSLHDALPILMARKNLPTIPTVLARILQLADAENTSGKELIAVVEHDQALTGRSEEHTSELQSPYDLVCRLLLEKKNKRKHTPHEAHTLTVCI